MHSPDRRYWWDGNQWQLAVSADGRWWFDGRQWVTNPLRPPRFVWIPTKWTRPLQLVVITIALAGFAEFALTVPFVFGQMQQAVVIAPAGISPERASAMLGMFRTMTLVSLGLVGILGLAVTAFMVVGAARRWNWMFWVTLIVYGLPITVLPFALLGLLGVHPPLPLGPVQAPVPQIPMAVRVIGWLLNLAEFALVAAMLLIALRVGPWACRKLPEDLQPSPPSGEIGMVP